MPIVTRSQTSLTTNSGYAHSTVALRPGFWPCQKCSCRSASFGKRIKRCLLCGHTMNSHEPAIHNPWNPGCDFVSPRKVLVQSLLEHVRKFGVIVIRATPLVGKSVLLKLLGHHIAYQVNDLEPIFLNWQTRQKRNNEPYLEYLEVQERVWRSQNEKIRPRNPAARSIFLIDEAQDSYEEEDLWQMLKNHHNTRMQAFYVLVCVYGAAGVSSRRLTNVESQARQMHSLHRIELYPTSQETPCMLFTQNEVVDVAQRFALNTHCRLHPGLVEYLFNVTQGHPGMVGMLLTHIENLWRNGEPQPRYLGPDYLRTTLVKGERSFMNWLCDHGRGIWSPRFERDVAELLVEEGYRHLEFADVKKALREVARQPNGLTRLQSGFDEYAFCHRMGLLHTEHSAGACGETTFIFASPLHRNVAYRTLWGVEKDTKWQELNLQRSCMNAIARFSPKTLQNRRHGAKEDSWNIPERAFQNELFLCLNLELQHRPILAEFSQSPEGRIDFFVADLKWGIEVVQNGNDASIKEHVSRFLPPSGSYHAWKFSDYIVLNFCSSSTLSGLASKSERSRTSSSMLQRDLTRNLVHDQEALTHLFHVLFQPEKECIGFYTHDLKLLEERSLNEGRRGLENEFDVPDMQPNPQIQDLQRNLWNHKLKGLQVMLSKEERKQLQTELRNRELQTELENRGVRDRELQTELENKEARNRELQTELETRNQELKAELEELKRFVRELPAGGSRHHEKGATEATMEGAEHLG